jgi:DNA-binding NarL/FixJ family response regulator
MEMETSEHPTSPVANPTASLVDVESAVETTRARVLLVDDHPIVRQGLSRLINNEPDLLVCAEAASAEQAVAAIALHNPSIAIVDIQLDGFDGIELIKLVRQRHPDLPMLVLSMHDESLYAERVLRAGARGYVTKQEAPEKVMTAIRRVLMGEIYVSEKIASRLLHSLAGTSKVALESPLQRLSDRELQVFRLLGSGLSVRQIAVKLGLSVKTIETHREHIKGKLNVTSSSELLRYAIEHEVSGA